MRARFLLLIALVTVAAPLSAAAQTSSDPLVTAYRQYYAGDKTGAIASLNKILESKPDDLAARFASVAARNSMIRRDPAIVPQFEKDLDALIALGEARHAKTDADTEATFYLAQAYMLRAGYRFDNDKGMWGAARDGAKAKGYIEAYIKKHPEHDDAYYVLGLYNYYVELGPAFAKMLRFLLFIPSGDRKAGLAELERAASKGQFFANDAGLILMEVYSTYENRPEDAVALGERMLTANPGNDEVSFALAETYGSPFFERYDQSGDVYAAIAARHANDMSAEGSWSRYRAVQASAAERLEAWRVSDAIATLTKAIDEKPSKPEWVVPQFLLRRANYRALNNDAGAVQDVDRVLNEFKTPQWQKQALDLKKWMEDRRASGEAARYASLIPANRLMAEHRYAEAKQMYLTLQQTPGNALPIRYRLALIDFLTGNSERSMAEFSALSTLKTAPEAMRANALLYLARAHDLAGRRDLAVKTYKAVTNDYEKTRAGGLARIGLVTPYKRPKP